MELVPDVVEISSLSTAYGEEYLLIQNQGDDPADVYDVVLDETWVGAVQVLLGDVATDVPFYGLPPQESLSTAQRMLRVPSPCRAGHALPASPAAAAC